MRKKLSAEEARENPITAALNAATQAVARQAGLQDQVLKLKEDKQALNDKLAAIEEILDCDGDDCSSDDHLEEITEIVHGKAHDDDESGEE